MRLDNLQGAPRSTSSINPSIPETTAAPAGNGSPATPSTGTAVSLERRLADVLASVVKKDGVPVDANFFYELGADSLVMAQFCARVRKQPDLPAVSIKDIYQNPTISALAAALAPAEEATAQVQVQDRLAEVLSGVLGVEHVPVDADFFQDLGADSLVMARFCARVRKQPDLPAVSIKDIYQNPTISALAAALAPAEEATAQVQVQDRLAEVLSGVLGIEHVPVDADFFQDLGADSLVMATVLRPGAQAAGPAGGVHEGRLRQPERFRPRRGCAGLLGSRTGCRSPRRSRLRCRRLRRPWTRGHGST